MGAGRQEQGKGQRGARRAQEEGASDPCINFLLEGKGRTQQSGCFSLQALVTDSTRWAWHTKRRLPEQKEAAESPPDPWCSWGQRASRPVTRSLTHQPGPSLACSLRVGAHCGTCSVSHSSGQGSSSFHGLGRGTWSLSLPQLPMALVRFHGLEKHHPDSAFTVTWCPCCVHVDAKFLPYTGTLVTGSPGPSELQGDLT